MNELLHQLKLTYAQVKNKNLEKLYERNSTNKLMHKLILAHGETPFHFFHLIFLFQKYLWRNLYVKIVLVIVLYSSLLAKS